MRLLSYEDTRRMLDNTVVMLDGRLVYCTKINVDLKGTFICCETGERFVQLCDMDVLQNPKNSRIGYVNREGYDAMYVSRQAARIYRMGFSFENLVVAKGNEQVRWMNRSLGVLLQGLQESYINDYPSFEKALKLAQENKKIVAYDRSFAVSPAGKIMYQGRVVGKVHGPHEVNIVWEAGQKPIERQRPKLNWRKK